MEYFSYVVILGLSLVILPLFAPSEPIIYIAEARTPIEFEKVVELTENKEEDKRECSCIKGAREYGVSIPYNTNASDLVGNGMPQINGLILLRYDDIDHVAVIVIFTKGGMYVYEENFNNPPNGCRKGYRFIDGGDPAIRGFWTNQENDVVDNFGLILSLK